MNKRYFCNKFSEQKFVKNNRIKLKEFIKKINDSFFINKLKQLKVTTNKSSKSKFIFVVY